MALAATRFRPTKPHFFKPLLPDFLDGILIPISFFKYLDGHKCEGPVLLRTRRGNWTVKINGQRMMDGWIDFAKDNGLEVGDFLVFGYEEIMVFDVMVFDATACEREYTSFKIPHQFPKEEQESSDSDSEMDLTRSKNIPENPVIARVEAKPSSFKLDNPYFISTMKPYSLAGYTIVLMQNIPKAFARLNGLSNRQCDMIIKDEKRSWQVGLTHNCDGQAYIGNGWRSFRDAKHLKEGDAFALELVKKGKKPIMHFHRSKSIPENPVMARVKAKSCSFKLDNPYFISTMKPYSLAGYTINIPKAFARSNGLSNRQCDMIIKDEKRSWHVGLTHNCDGQAYIGNGWRSFRDAKHLKEGDTFALELVKNGKKPIMHFHRSKRIPNNPHIARVLGKSFSFKHDHPYFVKTLKPYAKSTIYIPKGFAKSNGLSHRRCEMIIKDGQRSWHVGLNHRFDGQAFIGNGWRSFRNAKCLKEGNTFALELVKNGKRPIMHFHWVDGEGKGKKKTSARPC